MDGLHHFQIRNNLKLSNIINNNLINELNRPLDEIIHQIKQNIKRWKEFDSSKTSEFILINIPDFNLQLYNKDSIIINMKVIKIGRAHV